MRRIRYRPSLREIARFGQDLTEWDRFAFFGQRFVSQEVVDRVLEIGGQLLPVSVSGQNAEEGLIIGIGQDDPYQVSFLIMDHPGREMQGRGRGTLLREILDCFRAIVVTLGAERYHPIPILSNEGLGKFSNTEYWTGA